MMNWSDANLYLNKNVRITENSTSASSPSVKELNLKQQINESHLNEITNGVVAKKENQSLYA